LDGQPIDGATLPRLTLDNVQAKEVGSYRVRVSNPGRNFQSEAAFIQINSRDQTIVDPEVASRDKLADWGIASAVQPQGLIKAALAGETDHGPDRFGLRDVPARSGFDLANAWELSRGLSALAAAADGDRPRSCACEGVHTAGWKSPSGGTFTRLQPKATASWQHGVGSCRR